MYLTRIILIALMACACRHGSTFKPDDYLILIGCKFLEAMNAERVKTLPGDLCEFDHKGSAFAYANEALFKIDLETGNIVWKSPARIYHSIKYSPIDDSIYYFSSEVFTKDGTSYLGLTLNALSAKVGKTTFTWKSSENLAILEEKFNIVPFPLLDKAPEHGLKAHHAPKETRVFLDANQIEVVTKPHPLLKEGSDIKEGDLLLTFMDYSLITVFSPKENKFRKSFKVPRSYGQLHGAQFIAPGHLLVFINEASPTQRASQVVELKGDGFDIIHWA